MPRRKRSTFGCVQEMRRGVWRIRWPEDTPHGRKRRSETVYGTRRDAERRLAEIRVAVHEDPTPTIGQIWDRYVFPKYEDEFRKGLKKSQTMRQYESAWRGFVAPRWRVVPIGSLKPKDVQDWLLTLTHGTGEKSLVLLRAITSEAQMLEIISADPMQRDYRLTQKGSRGRDVPDLAGLEGLWKVVRGTWPETAFLLCSHAGLRVGEAMGVKISDLEWRKDRSGVAVVIHVERQVTERRDVEDPKYKSFRVAVMTDPWASRLLEIVSGLREDAIWVLDDGASDPHEVPYRRRVVWRWRKILQGTEWEGLSLQKLRPAFETYMHWELGVPMEQVQRLMGHKSIDVTKIYDRPGDEAIVSVALNAARTYAGLGTI